MNCTPVETATTTVPSEPVVIVVGGGTMGSGIAETVLTSMRGSTVTVVERDEATGDAALVRMETSLRRRAAKTGEDVAAVIGRFTTSIGNPAGLCPDLVVEAVPEDHAMKAEILREASKQWPDALLASNTSSLSIDELAESVADPSRFLGMHFFNPVPRSELVELVLGRGTADGVVETARAWVAGFGKQSILVRDAPGFATSRLGVAIGLEAIRMLEDGVASAADIDKAMVLGYKFPIGPLALTDLIGLDVRLAIAEHLTTELGERFTPPSLLREKVAVGHLGKKTGTGFFEWPAT